MPRGRSTMEGMENLLVAPAQRLRTLGWAALLPAVMLICTVFWGIHLWTLTMVVAACIIAVLAPAVGADLLPVALIVLACNGFVLRMRDERMPPGSGTTKNYPLHTLVFGDGLPHVVDLSAGVVLLAFGVWLVPRTIGAHSGLARRNSELVSRVRRLTATRVDAVDAAAAELRRVERDLHDGAQARLVALGLSLRTTERLIRTDPDAAVALVTQAREHSALALAELRALVRGINPPVLAERGLGDALRALALDSPVPATAEISLPGRLPEPVEAAAYFAVAEALANAAKHAHARGVHIRAEHAAARLRIEVSDDGTGGADPDQGTGLHGVERRLRTFDGILAISSPPGGPTIVVIEVPCALSSPKISSC
jgi:signal transduction histidine kinase